MAATLSLAAPASLCQKWPPQPPSWHKSFREKDEQGSALLDLPPVEDEVDVVLLTEALRPPHMTQVDVLLELLP